MATRTTVTLEDDVLRLVREEALRRNCTFRETLNDLVRQALTKQRRAARNPFKVKPKALGLKPGYSLDSTSKLIEELEGPWHR